jgi:hypothetical protein
MASLTPQAQSQLRREIRESWHAVADVLPADDVWVQAKIHDDYGGGVLYQAMMRYRDGLWFTEGGSVTGCVPTHWREIRA